MAVRWRPVRIDPFIDQINPVDIPHVLPEKLDKLPETGQLDRQLSFRVRYRDIDINQHVNNVSYVEWALESVPHDIKRNRFVSELEINFLGETVFGDYIQSSCRAEDPSGNVFFHSLVRENDGLEVARVRTVWTNGKHSN
ncbi:MAG: thioesterase [Desulfobacterales bacterium]|nr:thioesterase [Desulfobacterales bacterium]